MKNFEHSIVAGHFNDGELTNKKECGYSFIRDGDNFYTIKLYMNPSNSYFLVKNKSNELYTLFSKIIRSTEGVNFKHPVGYAKLLDNNTSYMQLKFHIPKLVMFMDLYAS